MSAGKTTTKEEKQLAVATAVLDIIDREGLLGVTHSKVARKSDVSRAWIYEYIGKQKEALIEFAADEIATELSRIKLKLPDDRDQLKNQLKAGIDHLFDSTLKNPTAIKIYFRFKGTKNPIGEVIGKYEKQWIQKATKSATTTLGLSFEQASLLAELILTLRLGFAHNLATSKTPAVSRKRAEKIFEIIHTLISGGE